MTIRNHKRTPIGVQEMMTKFQGGIVLTSFDEGIGLVTQPRSKEQWWVDLRGLVPTDAFEPTRPGPAILKIQKLKAIEAHVNKLVYGRITSPETPASTGPRLMA